MFSKKIMLSKVCNIVQALFLQTGLFCRKLAWRFKNESGKI